MMTGVLVLIGCIWLRRSWDHCRQWVGSCGSVRSRESPRADPRGNAARRMAWFKWGLRFRNRDAGAFSHLRDLDTRTPMGECSIGPVRRTACVGNTGDDDCLESTRSELPLYRAVARRHW